MNIPVLHPLKPRLEQFIKESDMVKLIEKGKAREVPFGIGKKYMYEVNGHYYIYREIGKHYEVLR